MRAEQVVAPPAHNDRITVAGRYARVFRHLFVRVLDAPAPLACVGELDVEAFKDLYNVLAEPMDVRISFVRLRVGLV